MSNFVPSAAAPLDVSDPALIRRVAEQMASMGFVEDMRIADGETQPDSAAACLARCFAFDAPTPESTLRERLGNELVDTCFRLGLLLRRGSLAAGAVCFVPAGDATVFFDHPHPDTEQGMRHFVMGPGGTTQKLIGSVPKRRRKRVLDLCSGSGAAAFSAALYSDEAVAADYNERALNLARFGVAWNGLQHVGVRFTDRFSGVADETFDLIVCNPPFVVNPANASMFLSAGMGGDLFSEHIVRGMAAHLCEGGFAHLLCDVVATARQSSPERLVEWLTANGCDAMLFPSPPKGPSEYAESWMPPSPERDADGFRDERARWIRYYDESGFLAFQRFLVVLRKRTPFDTDPPNWTRIIDMPNVQQFYGHHILRLFANEDLLRAGEPALLAARLKLAPDARLSVQFFPNETRWIPESSSLRLTGGLDHEAQVANVLGLAASRLDGSITVDEFVSSFASQAGGEDAHSIQRAILDALSRLLSLGFLAPVEFFSTEGAP